MENTETVKAKAPVWDDFEREDFWLAVDRLLELRDEFSEFKCCELEPVDVRQLPDGNAALLLNGKTMAAREIRDLLSSVHSIYRKFNNAMNEMYREALDIDRLLRR